MVYWGKHRHVMGRGWPWFQGTKIGAGPLAHRDELEGWLLIYHAVTGTCNGFVYSISAMVLDLEQSRGKSSPPPSRRCSARKRRMNFPVSSPACASPSAAFATARPGRLAIYYGAADTVSAVCFGNAEEHRPVREGQSAEKVRRCVFLFGALAQQRR